MKTEIKKSKNKIDIEVKLAIKPYIEENNKLRNSLFKAYEEIDILKLKSIIIKIIIHIY